MRVSAPTRTSTFIFTSVLARSIASGLHLTPKKDASRCAPMARYVTESFLLIDFFIFRHHHAIVNEGDTHSLPVPYAVQRTCSHPSNMPDSTSKKLPSPSPDRRRLSCSQFAINAHNGPHNHETRLSDRQFQSHGNTYRSPSYALNSASTEFHSATSRDFKRNTICGHHVTP